jgi:DNA-binding GntR family transcriptional regulator
MEYRTKEEHVADYIREGILSGRFERGARLKQVELAKLLRTSITPVREALKLLAAEGYVTGSSYRGATVSALDADASRETVGLRVLLETYLIRTAIEKITPAELVQMRELANAFEAAVRDGNRGETRGINYRFHRLIYDIAGLPQTLHFVQVLWARYPFDLINFVEGRAMRAAEEHTELINRMAEGDVAGAMLAARNHIESGWNELRISMGQSS